MLMQYERMLYEFRRARRVLVDEWLRRCPPGMPDACTGCRLGHCCTQLTLAHPLEGLIAAQWMRLNGKAHLIEAAQAQGRAQHDIWWPEMRKLFELRDMEEVVRLAGHGADLWYERNEPCVFLDQATKECGIYPVRPVMCAAFYVKDRCPAGPLPPKGDMCCADNRDVVAAVVDCADVAIVPFLPKSDEPQVVASIPFPLAVAVGARMLDGDAVFATMPASLEGAG